MARAALISSIDEFTNMFSQEMSQLETVRSEVQSICDELVAIRSILVDVDAGADKEEAVRQQYMDLEKRIHEAETAIVNYVLLTGRHGRTNPLLKMCACWKDSENEINPILQPIKELNVKFKESSSHYSGAKSLHLGARLSEWIRSSVEFEKTEDDLSTAVGLEQDVNSVNERLLANKDSNMRRVISVLGIQGIGKTKLALEIYKNESVAKHFQRKAWVCASAMKNDSIEILKDIRKQIIEFQSDKRYLIVIDDVRDPQVWTKLRGIIPRGTGAGSKIMLTTRNVKVACYANYIHRLKVLSKEESWNLFIKSLPPLLISRGQLGNRKMRKNESATATFTQSPELETLGKKMVEKCGGIPNLIIELANLLSTMYANTVEWSCVLHGIDTYLITQEQHPWYNMSSYVDDILPSHVKQLLHLFPKATEIPRRRLILSCAVAGGLWQQTSSGIFWEDTPAIATTRLVQDLQDLNLIQPVKVSSVGITKRYRISPDRPLLQILNSESSSSDHHHDDTTQVSIHRLADHHNRNGAQDDDPAHSPHQNGETYKSLHSFWCFNYPGGYKPGQEVGRFLKSWINDNHLWFLRVLDLEGVYKPFLHKEIGELINLQYLGLRWTYSDTLPSSVEHLSNLQTLDIKHTDIGVYPSIRKMRKLQHLYLNERHPSNLVTQLCCLTDLQTLSGVILDDMSHAKDCLYHLTNLRDLRLKCRRLSKQQKEAMVNWIGELENLGTLKLTSKDEDDQWEEDATFSLLWKKLRNKKLSHIYLQGRLENLYIHHLDFGSSLTALSLSLTELTTDPMPILEELTELKFLRLFSKSFIGYRMCCSSKRFCKLQVLKIWKLEELVEWVVEDGAMPKLEELEIRSCKLLKMIPDVPKALRELKLTDMPKDFTNNVKGKYSEKVAHVSSIVVEDWSDSKISVELYPGRSCDFQGQLEKLFDPDGFAVNVTDLTLSETKLKEDSMAVLEKLPQLKVLILSSKSFTGKRMVWKTGGFKKLERLTIRELEELEELTMEEGEMGNFKELEIISCKNLKELPYQLQFSAKLKFAKMPEEVTEKYDEAEIVEDL